MFLKGYTPDGFRGQAFHIHVRHHDDWDELYFRDYINHHSDKAAEYAVLKQNLRFRFPHDRDAYTKGKTIFVKKYTVLARSEFGSKYLPHRSAFPEIEKDSDDYN